MAIGCSHPLGRRNLLVQITTAISAAEDFAQAVLKTAIIPLVNFHNEILDGCDGCTSYFILLSQAKKRSSSK